MVVAARTKELANSSILVNRSGILPNAVRAQQLLHNRKVAGVGATAQMISGIGANQELEGILRVTPARV